MATVEGGGDLVGFYQQRPATQKLEELKLYFVGGGDKKRSLKRKKELAWYSY